MWRWAVALASSGCVLLASSCSGAGAGRWGEEAIAYVDAFDEAGTQSIGALLGFYGPEVVFDEATSVGVAAVGRETVGQFLAAAFGDSVDESVRGDFAIDRTGLAIEWRWPTEGPRGESSDTLMIRDVDDSGLATLETHSGAIEDIEAGPVFLDEAEAAEDVVAAYLGAWSSSEPVRVAALYGTDARIEDSLLRIELDGRAAIRSFVESDRSRSVRSEPLLAETTPDGGDAVYVLWPDGVHDAVAHRIEATVSYTSDDGSGCPGRTVAKLSIADGRITEERRYHDVDDLRRCLDSEQLPEGWWTGLEPPAVPDDELTGVIEVDGQEVEVHNGTPALERLVAWGFDRFVDAGLGVPAVEFADFGEDVHAAQCADRRHGLALDVGGTTQLYLCFGEKQACADGDCEAFRLRIRQLMLHEIAHAWLNEHVDEATQQAFLELVGIEKWRDGSIPWEQRGVEQAANVLAWGVTDGRIDSTGDRTCDELSAAFQLLTGERPGQPCVSSSNG